jgi:hypothetical protein
VQRRSKHNKRSVLRLLRAIPLDEMAHGMRRLLTSGLAGDVTREAIELADLRQPDHIGPTMAARAVGGLEDPDVIAASLAALYSDLASELDQRP